MENNIENIYSIIARSINDSIKEDWLKSIIYAEISEDSIEFKSEYFVESAHQNSRYFDVPFEAFEAFEELHQITTEDSDNKWNRAKFTLEPTGKFNIDFEWDQALADEIERLNNE